MNIPTTGQVVYCKPDTLFSKILTLITADKKSVLVKKISRPYVVISNLNANKALKTVWVCPLKRVNNTDNLADKVLYTDKQGNLREIVANQIMTVQITDLCWDNFFLPLSIMMRVREKIIFNLPYTNLEERNTLKEKSSFSYSVEPILRKEELRCEDSV